MISNDWRFWLGLAVTALLLMLLVYQVDLGEVRDAVGQANYVYVVPAVALYFVAVFFRALRWRYLLSPMRLLPVSRLYPVVVIGYMANNLLPARLGELVRAYYLARREHLNTSATLATVAVERVYDGLTLLAFAAVAAPVLLALGRFDGASDASRTIWIVVAGLTIVLFLGALTFLTALAGFPRFLELVQWWTGLVPSRFRPKVQQLVHTFVQGLSILSSPRKHLALFLLSVPVWLFEGATYFLIGNSFGIDQLFDSVWVWALVVLLVTATSNLATAVPAAVGGIGPFEVVAQQTLLALGVDASLGAAYAAFVHLVALWLPVNVAGLVLVWKQNLSLRQLVGAGRAQAQEAAAGPLGHGISPAPPAKEELP